MSGRHDGHPRIGPVLLLEQWWPFITATLFAAVAWFVSPMMLFGSAWRETVLDKTIVALSIFVAYLAMAVTVIPAIEDKAIIRRLRRWGYLKYIVGYISAAISVSAFLLVYSIVLSALPDSKIQPNPRVNHILSSAWWAFVAYSCGTGIRAVRTLINAILAN